MHDVVTAHLDPISTLIPWGSPSPNSESDLVKNKVTSGRCRTHNSPTLPIPALVPGEKQTAWD